MIRRPPRSTRTDPPFPTRRSSDLAARPDLQRHFISLGRVGGFDSTVKAEAAVVGDPNGFFVSVEADDSADWSADFFLCDGHAVIDVIEQIGRAHFLTPVTNSHLVCRLLLETKKRTTIIHPI